MRALILSAALAAGCASYSTRMDATPAMPGENEIGLAMDALVVERGRAYKLLPSPELSINRGLRPGLDLVGKAHLIGGELSARFSLCDGPLRVAAAAGLGVGYEPVTNNTTDLIYARAIPRFIIGFPVSPETSLIAAASPSLTFTGPLTLFAGITDPARWILRPGLTVAVQTMAWRHLWFEVTAQPAYAIGDGWMAPSFQGGAAIWF